MVKPILIAVHGMGNHTKESSKSKIRESLTECIKLYPGYEENKIEDFVQIKAVGYNDIFEKWRQKIAEDTSETLNQLSLSAPQLSLIKEGMRLHSNIKDDDNLYTHWLDVLFYLSLIGEWVRISVAEQITQIYMDALDKSNNPKISIIASSLGTAVIHDTLSKLYMGDIAGSEQSKKWKELKLDANKFSLHSLFQIANVSPLLETFSNPYTSIVRPGSEGCCHFMYNFDHVLDPIPKLIPFKPDPNEGWISADEWVDRIFIGKTIYEITKVNVHQVEHYLANPNVHLRIFRTLIKGFKVKKKDAKKVYSKYVQSTLQHNVKALRRALKEVSIADRNSLKEIVDAFKKSAEIIKTYEELT